MMTRTLTPEQNEKELLLQARAGDKVAFSRLVGMYQTPVYNLCYRMLGQMDEAQDAAQETFLRAFSQLWRYDAGRPFKTWLFAIANHHCIDQLRRRRATWVDIEDEAVLYHPALREPRLGPEELTVQGDERERVQALLTSLPPADRAVVVMRYWYDLSYEEIAKATGTTVSAVKSRLHRARLAMAAMLKPSREARPVAGLVSRPSEGTRSSLTSGYPLQEGSSL